MIAKELMSQIVATVKTSDKGSEVLSLMDELKLSHLPVVNNTEYLGLISETDIDNHNNPEDAVGSHRLSLTRPFVTQYQHIFEVLKQMNSLKLTVIPVVDDKNNYLGSITHQALIANFDKIAAIQNPGGVIVLEVSQNDYQLSEIARIVESNDAKILSMFVTTHHDSTKMEVILKINRIDISAVMQTLIRYDYTIKASYSESGDDDIIKERYDALMNFLNI